MKPIYTIGCYKLWHKTIGFYKTNAFNFENVNVNGENMSVFFCKDEKGMFVVAGKYRKGRAHYSCGHWHSADGFYDIYFRKNFRTKEDGNTFYKKVKTTMKI